MGDETITIPETPDSAGPPLVAGPGATEGRMVHYILAGGPHKGDHRAAIMVRVWSESCANLRVLFDGTNDYPHDLPARQDQAPLPYDGWYTSVCYADPAAAIPGTWHWIERV